MIEKKEGTLHLHRICLVTCVWLVGCASDAGLHSHHVALDDAMLTTSYSDTAAFPLPANEESWQQFHDPVLQQLIASAITDSPSLQIAQSRVEQARHLAEQASSALWPRISADAQLTREHITANGLFPPPYGGNTYTETNLALNFNYEFDFWGKNRQALAARVSAARAVEADRNAACLVITASVAYQYFQLQYDVAALALGKTILHQRQALYDIVKVHTKNGIASDIPLSQSLTQLATAKNSVTALQEQVKLSQHQLAVLVGKNPFTTVITPSAFNYHQHMLRFPAVIHANILGQRPDVVAARWRIETAAHQVNVAKSRFYPNINLLGVLSLQSFSLSKAFYSSSRDNSAGAAIDLPIFDAGARRANLAVQYDEYDMAREQYNQTLLNGLQDVANQASILHALELRLHEQQIAMKASSEQYRLTRAQYQHGITDYTGTLEVQDSYLQEKTRQLQLESLHLQAAVLMLKALGGHYPQEG